MFDLLAIPSFFFWKKEVRKTKKGGVNIASIKLLSIGMVSLGGGGGGESGTGRVKLLACAKGRGDSS